MDEDFMVGAEEPAVFAAFCLTMRHLRVNPSYPVTLPVFLDATCSGIQHLSAMLGDEELAKEVNLLNSDTVHDLYSTLVLSINQSILDHFKDDETNSNMVDVKLTRKELKSIIMTKAYNVTTIGIIDQLKESLEKVEEEVDKTLIKTLKFKTPAKNHQNFLLLNHSQLGLLGGVISNNIFNLYPSLNTIYNFFMTLVKTMVSLSIPVS